MTKAVLLLAVLLQAAPSRGPAGVPGPGDPLLPDTVLALPGGQRIVRLDMPGSPLVALRVSVPVEEGPSEAGAAHLLQSLGVDRAMARSGQLGVQVEGTRTPWGVAYSVVGSKEDFDFLAYLLREAVAEPREGGVEFERARLALRSDVLRSQETAAGRLVAALRSAAAPSTPPLEGTLGSIDTLTPAALRQLWARTHRPAAMRVVVAGDLPDELVLAAFQALGEGAGEASPAPRASAPRGETVRTQVLRHWYGEAHATADPRDPHPPVVALLLSEHLRAVDEDFESHVQLWEMQGRQVVAVVAAAYPGSAVRMRSAVRSALAGVRQGVGAEDVGAAVARVRLDFLQGARTPAGLVGAVGHHLDATGAPDAARGFLDALGGVTLDSTRSFLAALERQATLRAEVRP